MWAKWGRMVLHESGEASGAATQEGAAHCFAVSSVLAGRRNAGRDLRLTAGAGVLWGAAAGKCCGVTDTTGSNTHCRPKDQKQQ